MGLCGCRQYREHGLKVVRIAAIGGLLATTETAHPQMTVDTRMERDTVGARSRPGYEPIPIRFGTLEVSPVLQVDTTVTDNLYARSDVKVHDTGIALRPAVTITTQGTHHQLAVTANAQANRWARHHAENTEAYGVSADGSVDLAQGTRLIAQGSQERLIEARGTTGDTLFGSRPISYDRTVADLALEQDFGVTKLRLGGRYERFAYQNRMVDGSVVDLSPRNFEQVSGSLRVLQGLSPGVAGFVDLGLAHGRYPVTLPNGFDRTSNTAAGMVGVAFGLNRLLQGEAGVGYLDQRFHDARFPAIRGLAYKMALAWSPTPLTTLHLRGSSSLQRSPIVSIAGVREDTFNLAADHELLRNVILRPSLTVTRAAFRGGERRDTYMTAQFGATWLVDTHWQVDLSVSHALGRNNVLTTRNREYDTNRAMLSVRYRL